MHSDIQALLQPRSVAVIGASDNPNKVGGRPIHYMSSFGFTGAIYPVNPGRAEVQGYRCFPSLEAIGEIPDAVVVAVSNNEAMRAVEQCAALGVRLCIVLSSGFAETGAAGRALQEKMIGTAHATGMRLVGPNAQGLANFATGAVLNFSTMFMEVAPQDGPIAIVSQSGAASVMPYALLRESGLGVRYLCATGNDADLGVAELTMAVARDPFIKLILVYAESVSHPEMLAQAAAIARERGASIVLLKGGASERGAKAAASHTGAMVGHDGALDAFLERHGIWRAHDMRELVAAASLYLAGASCGDRRTIVMSHSGAVGVMCADAAERAGLPLTNLSDTTCEALRGILPDFASAHNPLDLTAALMGRGSMFGDVLDVLGRDPQADMFLVGVPVAGPGYDVPALAQTTARFARDSGKTVVVSAPQESVRREFAAFGIPVFRTESEAVRALHQYATHRRTMARIAPLRETPSTPLGAHGLLGEADSLRLLQRAGVTVVEHVVCNDADSAQAAFLRLGVPVVVKGCAADVPHKSEHGLVRLNLKTASEVRQAAVECLALLASMDCAQPQVLVAAMVRGVHEFMLGATIDPIFGPIVMAGEGGTLVEIRRDMVTLLAPFSEQDARHALDRLRIAPLYAGYRDMPAMDIDALARAAVMLGDFAYRHRDSLRSVDINPVIALPGKGGVVAVDAVVELVEETGNE